MEDLDDRISEITERYANEAKDKISLKKDLELLIDKVILDQITKVQFLLDKEKNKINSK